MRAGFRSALLRFVAFHARIIYMGSTGPNLARYFWSGSTTKYCGSISSFLFVMCYRAAIATISKLTQVYVLKPPNSASHLESTSVEVAGCADHESCTNIGRRSSCHRSSSSCYWDSTATGGLCQYLGVSLENYFWSVWGDDQKLEK